MPDLNAESRTLTITVPQDQLLKAIRDTFVRSQEWTLVGTDEERGDHFAGAVLQTLEESQKPPAEPLPVMVEQAVADELNTIARDLGVRFESQGEVGFGRRCVGFLKGSGYVNYHPRNDSDYRAVDLPGVQDDRLLPHDAPDAYHKHECFAVLAPDGNYAEAARQLLAWMKHLQSMGRLEVVEYPTLATGIQAIVSGTTGYALRFVQE